MATALLERAEQDESLAEDRVEQIRQLFNKIDKGDSARDPIRWEAAELVAAEVEGGKSTRALGKQLDRSAMYVSRYNRAWKRYQDDPSVRERPFWRAYEAPAGVTAVTADRPQLKAAKLLEVLETWEGKGAEREELEAIATEAEAFAARVHDWAAAA